MARPNNNSILLPITFDHLLLNLHESVVMFYQYMFLVLDRFLFIHSEVTLIVNFLILKAIWRSSSFIDLFSSSSIYRLILQVFKRIDRMDINANLKDHLFDRFIIWNLDQPTRWHAFSNMLFYLWLKKYIIEKSQAQLHIHYPNVVVNITWNHHTRVHMYSKETNENLDSFS